MNKFLLQCTALSFASLPSVNAVKKPNVIFILLDDSGYADFACYGQTKIETPNIDALASNGIRFTNMYAGAPQSAPSRCGLLTGFHNGHTQIRANDEQYWRGDVYSLKAMLENPELEGQAPMLEGTQTLGTLMQQAGYKTAMVGKWGLGGPTTKSTPNQMGFDFFYGYLCQRSAQCYYPQYLYKNEKREMLNNPFMELGSKLTKEQDPLDLKNYTPFKGAAYSPDVMYEEIEKFISDNSKNPFFLMWTTTIPHSAMQAPDEYVDYYVKKFGDEKPVARANSYFPCRYPKATYAAMITYLDYQIGKMVKKIKELNINENTIIIVTSDNGPAQSKFNFPTWFESSAPFRSDPGYTKRTLHEGGIRMPFIVNWGKKIKPQVTSHLCYFPDIMPTLADIAGVKAPIGDGISIWSTILGQKKTQRTHDYLYWEFPAFKDARGFVAVRIGQFKGLVSEVADGNNHMQIFNIDADPREEHDLSAQYPDLVKKMWQIIKKEHTPIENEIFQLSINFPQGV